jgi:hypothetical protein
MRYEIEARLMIPGITFEEVSRATDLHKNVIAWFAMLFFDVADKHKNSTYMVHCVLGNRFHQGLNTKRDFPILWKMFAWMGGAAVLDSVMFMTKVNPPENVDGVDGFLTTFGKRALRRKAALATQCVDLEANSLSKFQILELNHKLHELEKEVAAPVNDVCENLNMVAGQLNFLFDGSQKGIIATRANDLIVGKVDNDDFADFSYPKVSSSKSLPETIDADEIEPQ